MRKIQRLASLFSSLKIDYLIRNVRSKFVSDIPILAYHRIVNLSDNSKYPFDIDLISASPNDFLWQMEFIKMHFTPIKLSMLCDYLDGSATLPKNPIIVTFDDGFDDNYYAAFPILRDLDIPATIFVTTSFIDDEHTIWYERLAHFILTYEDVIKIPELDIQFPPANGVNNRKAFYSVLVESLKLVENKHRLDILSNLYKRYKEDYLSGSISILKQSRPVSWEQLNEMSSSVFEVGSHSVTHPVLTTLSDDELEYELVESKSVLEEKMGHAIDTIAYPVGMEFAFDERVKKAARNTGYKLGLSYMEGENHKRAFDRYALSRMHIDRDMSKSTFSCKLTLPAVFKD